MSRCPPDAIAEHDQKFCWARANQLDFVQNSWRVWPKRQRLTDICMQSMRLHVQLLLSHPTAANHVYARIMLSSC